MGIASACRLGGDARGARDAHGIDSDAIREELTPRVTMETTRETIEWVRKQTPLGRKS